MIRDGYLGIDSVTGALTFSIPGEILVYGMMNDEGKICVFVRDDEGVVTSSLAGIMANGEHIRYSIKMGDVWKIRVPKRIAMKYDKFRRRGQDEKARSQISSLCKTLFYEKHADCIGFLEDEGCLNLGSGRRFHGGENDS
jgi:hypothetical protein